MTGYLHRLIVTHEFGGIVRYEVTHPGCESVEGIVYMREGSGRHYVTHPNCGVGYLVENEGLAEALRLVDYGTSESVSPIRHLPPGMYELWFDSHTSPSTPNGPAEYDAWLEVTKISNIDTTQDT